MLNIRKRKYAESNLRAGFKRRVLREVNGELYQLVLVQIGRRLSQKADQGDILSEWMLAGNIMMKGDQDELEDR